MRVGQTGILRGGIWELVMSLFLLVLGAISVFMSCAHVPGLGVWFMTHGVHGWPFVVFIILLALCLLPSRRHAVHARFGLDGWYFDVMRGAVVGAIVFLFWYGDLWNRTYELSFVLFAYCFWIFLVTIGMPSCVVERFVAKKVAHNAQPRGDDESPSTGSEQHVAEAQWPQWFVKLCGELPTSTAILHGAELATSRQYEHIRRLIQRDELNTLDDVTPLLSCLEFEFEIWSIHTSAATLQPGRGPLERAQMCWVLVCEALRAIAQSSSPVERNVQQDIDHRMFKLIRDGIGWAEGAEEVQGDLYSVVEALDCCERDDVRTVYELGYRELRSRTVEACDDKIKKIDISFARSIIISHLNSNRYYSLAEGVSSAKGGWESGTAGVVESDQGDPLGGIVATVLSPITAQKSQHGKKTDDTTLVREYERLDDLSKNLELRARILNAKRDLHAANQIVVPRIWSPLHVGSLGVFPVAHPVSQRVQLRACLLRLFVVFVTMLTGLYAVGIFTTWAEDVPGLVDRLRQPGQHLNETRVLSSAHGMRSEMLFLGTERSGVHVVQPEFYAVVTEPPAEQYDTSMSGPQQGAIANLAIDQSSGVLLAEVQHTAGGHGLSVRDKAGQWTGLIDATPIKNLPAGSMPVAVSRLGVDRVIFAMESVLLLYDESLRSLSTLEIPGLENGSVRDMELSDGSVWLLASFEDGNRLFSFDLVNALHGHVDRFQDVQLAEEHGRPVDVVAHEGRVLIRTSTSAVFIQGNDQWELLRGGAQWDPSSVSDDFAVAFNYAEDCPCIIMPSGRGCRLGVRQPEKRYWLVSDQIDFKPEVGTVFVAPEGDSVVVLDRSEAKLHLLCSTGPLDGDGPLQYRLEHTGIKSSLGTVKGDRVLAIDGDDVGVLITSADTSSGNRYVEYVSWDTIATNRTMDTTLASRPLLPMSLAGEIAGAHEQDGRVWFTSADAKCEEYSLDERSKLGGEVYRLAGADGENLPELLGTFGLQAIEGDAAFLACFDSPSPLVLMYGSQPPLVDADVDGTGALPWHAQDESLVSRSFRTPSRVLHAWDADDGQGFIAVDVAGRTWAYDLARGWRDVSGAVVIRNNTVVHRFGNSIYAIDHSQDSVVRWDESGWSTVYSHRPISRILPSDDELVVLDERGSIIELKRQGDAVVLMPPPRTVGAQLQLPINYAVTSGRGQNQVLFVADEAAIHAYWPTRREWTKVQDTVGDVRLHVLPEGAVVAWDRQGESAYLISAWPALEPKVLGKQIVDLDVRSDDASAAIVMLLRGGEVVSWAFGDDVLAKNILRPKLAAVEPIASYQQATTWGERVAVAGDGRLLCAFPNGDVVEVALPDGLKCKQVASTGAHAFALMDDGGVRQLQFRSLDSSCYLSTNLHGDIASLIELDQHVVAIGQSGQCYMIDNAGIARKILNGDRDVFAEQRVDTAGLVIQDDEGYWFESVDESGDPAMIHWTGAADGSVRQLHGEPDAFINADAAYLFDDSGVYELSEGSLELVDGRSADALFSINDRLHLVSAGGLAVAGDQGNTNFLHANTNDSAPWGEPILAIEDFDSGGVSAFLSDRDGNILLYDGRLRKIVPRSLNTSSGIDRVNEFAWVDYPERVVLAGEKDGASAIEVIDLKGTKPRGSGLLTAETFAIDRRQGRVYAVSSGGQVDMHDRGRWSSVSTPSQKFRGQIKRICVIGTDAFMLDSSGELHTYTAQDGLNRVESFGDINVQDMWPWGPTGVVCFDGSNLYSIDLQLLQQGYSQIAEQIRFPAYAGGTLTYLTNANEIVRLHVDGSSSLLYSNNGRAYPGSDPISTGTVGDAWGNARLRVLDDLGGVFEYAPAEGTWSKIAGEFGGFKNTVLGPGDTQAMWIVHDRGAFKLMGGVPAREVIASERPIEVAAANGTTLAWLSTQGSIFRDEQLIDDVNILESAGIEIFAWPRRHRPIQFASYEVEDNQYVISLDGNSTSQSVGESASCFIVTDQVMQWSLPTRFCSQQTVAFDGALLGVSGGLLLLSDSLEDALLSNEKGEMAEVQLPEGLSIVGWHNGQLILFDGFTGLHLLRAIDDAMGIRLELDSSAVTPAPLVRPEGSEITFPAEGSYVFDGGRGQANDLSAYAFEKDGSIWMRREAFGAWKKLSSASEGFERTAFFKYAHGHGIVLESSGSDTGVDQLSRIVDESVQTLQMANQKFVLSSTTEDAVEFHFNADSTGSPVVQDPKSGKLYIEQSFGPGGFLWSVNMFDADAEWDVGGVAYMYAGVGQDILTDEGPSNLVGYQVNGMGLQSFRRMSPVGMGEPLHEPLQIQDGRLITPDAIRPFMPRVLNGFLTRCEKIEPVDVVTKSGLIGREEHINVNILQNRDGKSFVAVETQSGHTVELDVESGIYKSRVTDLVPAMSQPQLIWATLLPGEENYLELGSDADGLSDIQLDSGRWRGTEVQRLEADSAGDLVLVLRNGMKLGVNGAQASASRVPNIPPHRLSMPFVGSSPGNLLMEVGKGQVELGAIRSGQRFALDTLTEDVSPFAVEEGHVHLIDLSNGVWRHRPGSRKRTYMGQSPAGSLGLASATVGNRIRTVHRLEDDMCVGIDGKPLGSASLRAHVLDTSGTFRGADFTSDGKQVEFSVQANGRTVPIGLQQGRLDHEHVLAVQQGVDGVIEFQVALEIRVGCASAICFRQTAYIRHMVYRASSAAFSHWHIIRSIQLRRWCSQA